MIIHFCPGCGKKAKDEFKFCPYCGLKFPRDEATESEAASDHEDTIQPVHRTPGKLSPEGVSVRDEASCSPSNKVVQSRELPSCSPKASGNTKRLERKSTSSPRTALKRKVTCTPEKEQMEKIKFSPAKCEFKCETSPRSKKSKNVQVQPLPENDILTDNNNTKWVLAKLLAQEKTGFYYTAHISSKSDNKDQCVLKLDAIDGKIYNEQNFFQRAAKKMTVDKWKKNHDCPALGIPTCIGFGVHDCYRFLVFDALGQNFQTIINENKGQLPEIAVYQILYRMIDVLEYVHENEYVHGNITAENVYINSKYHEVYLAGYYNAFRYCPGGKHVVYKDGNRTPHEGTTEFISLDVHKGTDAGLGYRDYPGGLLECACLGTEDAEKRKDTELHCGRFSGPTRRSDLESLGYCMLKWLCRSLPWSDETNPCSVMEYKKRFKTDVPGLLKQCFNRRKIPDVPKLYLEKVMNLNYEEKPDYHEIRNNFSSFLQKANVKPYDPVQL